MRSFRFDKPHVTELLRTYFAASRLAGWVSIRVLASWRLKPGSHVG
jgi:hypothetical protein